MNQKTKAECIRRMKILGISNEKTHPCISNFKKTDEIWKSECHGILRKLNETEIKLVKAVEKKYKRYEMKIYHCYKAYTNSREILYMLFHGNSNMETDEEFKTNLREDDSIFCYAEDLTDHTCSDFAFCHIRTIDGGIVLY